MFYHIQGDTSKEKAFKAEELYERNYDAKMVVSDISDQSFLPGNRK
jgi:hypothetical protein